VKESLNDNALMLVKAMLDDRDQLRISDDPADCGSHCIDCGVAQPGGLAAGRWLAEVCLGGLGEVCCESASMTGTQVVVQTDHPVVACLGGQYAGWKIRHGEYFAIGSGPMRVLANKEELIQNLGLATTNTSAVGVLETSKLPPGSVCQMVAKSCGVAPEDLWLLVAATSSLAGSIQVVARSVETALHQLHELDFPIERIVSAWGVAPLPPIAKDDMQGIGRTNDAILYAGDVTLWFDGDDEDIQRVGASVPSSASPDYGEPFGDIFKRYDYDFYKIDPSLFSPARIRFINVKTGRTLVFGTLAPDIAARSFGL
jgi:methenyltetrahydromethanopterin cyclohydrolase